MSTIPKHPNSVESATSTRLAQSSSGLSRTRKLESIWTGTLFTRVENNYAGAWLA